VIVSPEALLESTGGRFDDREAVGKAWADAMRQFRDALADPSILDVGVLVGIPGSGKSTWCAAHDDPRIVLFDAVWSSRGRRVSLCDRIRRARKNAIAVSIRCALAVAKERNAARPPDRRVPESVINAACLALRRDPPTRAEGWDRVILVAGG
jgi:predicted kinase